MLRFLKTAKEVGLHVLLQWDVVSDSHGCADMLREFHVGREVMPELLCVLIASRRLSFLCIVIRFSSSSTTTPVIVVPIVCLFRLLIVMLLRRLFLMLILLSLF